MADVTITAANVIEVSGVKRGIYIAGEAITAGAVFSVKLDGSIKKAYLAVNNANDNAKAEGIALCNAAAGQPFVGAKDGIIYLGEGAVTSAAAYFVSNTAGKLCPSGDIGTTGEYITLMGMALPGGNFLIVNKFTNEQIPAA